MKILPTVTYLTFVLLSSFAQAGELIDESFEVDDDEIIDIEIASGVVSIVGWDDKRFAIIGELSEDSEGFDLDRSNGITHFEERQPDKSWRNNRFFCFSCSRNDLERGANLEIFVPLNSVITFEGVNVELSLDNLQGNTEMKIVSGPVFAQNLSGSINLSTVSGNIEANELTGRIELSTVSGTVIDHNSSGSQISYSTVNGNIESFTESLRVSASTVNGNVDLNLSSIDDLDASTVNGDIEVTLDLKDSGRIDLSTVGGSVVLNVDPNISARFEVNTAVGGEIDNRLTDNEVVEKNRFVNSSELRFSLNGGNADVDISTLSGDVLLDSK